MNRYCPSALSSSPVALRHTQGVTLVELMITIAVAAVLIAVAAPSFTSLRFSQSLATQANDMLWVINFARSEAIRRNRPVTLCRSSTEASTTCVTANGVWRYWIVLANGSVIRRGVISEKNGLSQSSTLTADSLVIGADGLTRTNNTLVNNQYLEIIAPISAVEKNARRVVLGAGSRINIQKLSLQQ
ncbi:MAG: hypothetical protein BWK73_31755 [Thiothrix lacustris]|uniref:Type II secretion system protein H n=1 Tax=Thiothrix lacustris TaxID=525917 RepID=A0A1Y1QHU5_9GAMM|nr:MAG: hypothetical protein BWK73_31755 [Thiothrix lacustris]